MSTIFEFAKKNPNQNQVNQKKEMSIFDYAMKKYAPKIEEEKEAIETPKKEPSPLFQKAKEEPKKQLEEIESLRKNTKEPEEDLEKEIERHTARGTSRVLETVGGLVGDIQSFLGHLGIPKTLRGLPFPTSEEHQKASEYLTGGYTTPKNELEAKGDELIKDVVNFATPGSGEYNLFKNLGIPILGNLAKEGVIKYGNFGEKGATAAKIGTILALDLSLGNRKKGGANKYVSELYDKAFSSIPENEIVSSSNLTSSLKKLKKELEKGGKAPSTDTALEKLNEILGKAEKGEIEVDELVKFRKKINEHKKKLGGFDVIRDNATRNQAIHNLDLVNGEVSNTLTQYGKSKNLEFLKNYEAANESYRTLQASNKITNFVKKHYGDKFISGAAKTLYGVGGSAALGAGLKFFPIPTVVAGLGLPVYQTVKLLQRISKSPTLARYYKNIMKYSLQENVAGTVSNLKALDHKLAEEEKKREKRKKQLISQ